jgi:hypothetical protein
MAIRLFARRRKAPPPVTYALVERCLDFARTGREPPLPAQHPLRHALCALDCAPADARAPAEALLLRVAAQAPQLLTDPCDGSATYGAAIVHLAYEHARFVQPVDDVRVSRVPGRLGFERLVRDLLARFPLPRFVYGAFTDPVRNPDMGPRVALLGAGASVHEVLRPLKLSRRAAHLFRDAPADVTFVGALRWAQVRAAGGDEALAQCVADVSVVARFLDVELEQFLVRALGWLIAHDVSGLDTVDRVLRYALARADFDPSFRLRGLRRDQVIEDATEFSIEADERPFVASGLSQPVLQDAQGGRWLVTELAHPVALFLEGERMSHCVWGYADEVREQSSALFSLRRFTPGGGQRRALTVEVDLHGREVVQARGRGNREPKEAEVAVLARWAAQNSLRVTLSDQ